MDRKHSLGSWAHTHYNRIRSRLGGSGSPLQTTFPRVFQTYRSPLLAIGSLGLAAWIAQAADQHSKQEAWAEWNQQHRIPEELLARELQATAYHEILDSRTYQLHLKSRHLSQPAPHAAPGEIQFWADPSGEFVAIASQRNWRLYLGSDSLSKPGLADSAPAEFIGKNWEGLLAWNNLQKQRKPEKKIEKGIPRDLRKIDY
jgi:hypothetical protein